MRQGTRGGIVLVMSCVAAVLFPRAARAWNEAGHMVVARIAWRELDVQQRAEVSRLLRRHPHYDSFLAAHRSGGVDEDEWAFLRAAVWPDWVRPARPANEGELFKGPEITRYHRGPWHYISTPWQMPSFRRASTLPTTSTAAATTSTAASTRPTPQPEARENVLTALDANARMLADASRDAGERAVALAWLMHLVGDVHQPLHAINMFAADLPEGDRGGNDILVRGDHNVLRLHAYWDGVLGNSDAYDAVALLADNILADGQLHRGRLRELAERPAFASWAAESHRWAIALVYLNGRLRCASSEAYDRRQISDADVPPVPHSYYANARLLARRRVALAGHRLAEQIATLVPPQAETR